MHDLLLVAGVIAVLMSVVIILQNCYIKAVQESEKAGNELIAVQHRISEEDNRAAEGKVMRVLAEQPARHREGWMSGRCENGMVITFPAEGIAPGQFAQVRITRGLRSEYEGELITQ